MQDLAFILWGFLFGTCFLAALVYGAVSSNSRVAQWQAVAIVWFFGAYGLMLKLITAPLQVTVDLWAVFLFWLMLGPLLWIIDQGAINRHKAIDSGNRH